MPLPPDSSTFPSDQGERLVAQAARFGRAELTRAADLVAAGLTEMRGATAPRLLLELICARVLLPGGRPRHRRCARPARPARAADGDRRRRRRARAASGRRAHPTAAPPAAAPGRGTAAARRRGRRAPRADVRRPAPEPEPAEPSRPRSQPRSPHRGARAPTAARPSLSLVDVRRPVADVIAASQRKRRVTWIHLTPELAGRRLRRHRPDPGLQQRRRPRQLRRGQLTMSCIEAIRRSSVPSGRSRRSSTRVRAA